jgi:hypothetical protein
VTRRYINREETGKNKISAEDEWAHLTDIPDENKKLEISDALDVQDRIITFGNQEQEPKTRFDAVKKEARLVMDAAGNTGQYIRFVKSHIDNQKKEIDKIKKIKEKFDQQIRLLQSPTVNWEEIEKKPIAEQDVKTVTDYLQQILKEKNLTKKKLDILKDEITLVEEELEQEEEQIEKINDEILQKKDEQTKLLKNELNQLIEKYGIKNFSDALDEIKSDDK